MHVQHVFFIGNRKKGVRWLSWAKTKLKDLQRYHPGFDGASFGVKRYSLEAGEDGFIEVLIKMVKEQEWIIIWAEETPSIYMESGLLDHRNIAPLNEDTYLPSILHYGDDIKAIRGEFAELGKLRVKEVATNKLDGENLGEGDSNSVGCPKEEKLISITASSDFGARTFEAQKPIYCAPSRIYSVKNVQSRMPPSMFSGKLRLFVQALYGSKRDDYALDPLLEELGPLKLSNVDLKWTYNGNTALFSGRDYEYFLLQVFSSGLWGRAMTTTDAGKALRKYLNDNPGIPTERKKRYETYLLSTLYVSSESSWVKITGEVGDSYVKGTPWYYGWSWNMDGTEARAVTIQLKPGTDNVWQSTMFGISVAERDLAETLEEGRLAAGFRTLEETQDFTGRTNQDLVWWPNEVGEGMRPWIPAPLHSAAPHADFNVPFYAITDYKNDKFDVIRFKRENKGSGVGVLGGGHDDVNDTAMPQCGTHDCDYYSDADGAIEIGIYVEGYDSWEAVGIEGHGVVLNGNEAAVGEPSTITPNPTSKVVTINRLGVCGNAVDGDDVKRFEHFDAPTSGGELSLGGDLDFEWFLVIPYYNCDAVHIGRWAVFTGNISSARTEEGSTVSTAVTIIDNDDNVTATKARMLVTWKDGAPCGNTYALTTKAKCQDKWVSASKSDAGWNHVDVRYFADGGDVELYQQQVSSEGLAEALFVPSCMSKIIFGSQNENLKAVEEGVPNWSEEALDLSGYSNHFNPVLFPEPVPAENIISKHSANFQSFRVTSNPGSAWKEDGGYGFDKNNISNLFSFVGFA